MGTKIELQVKDKSVIEFLKDNLIEGEEKRHILGRDSGCGPNPYYALKKEMFFKKSDKFYIGDTVIITLSDFSQSSRQQIVNDYVYEVQYYDDISLKLVQTRFTVSHAPEDIK